MILWTTAAPAVGAAFLASAVEAVEAFTIVLAASVLRGWKPATAGTLTALCVLSILVLSLAPLLNLVPLQWLQLVVGVLLLLFGMGWLRKAILRSAGIIPLHDETAIFAEERAILEDEAKRHETTLNWIAGLASFKAVLLEGLEVVFIVVAIGAGNGLLIPAAFGAFSACVMVLLVGTLLHRPLSQVPENTLKFAVGVILSSFGVFWVGEGLGVPWPGHDFILFGFAGIFLLTGIITASALRHRATGIAQ